MYSKRAMLGALLASSSATMGGATVVLVRYVLPQTDPFSLSMLRYGIGSLFLMAIVFAIGRRTRIAAADWPAIVALSALFYTLFPWAFAASLEFTTAARAGIVYTSMPLIALVLGTALGKEQFTVPKLIAVAIALTGIAITLSDSTGDIAPEAWHGDLLMALAASCCAIYVLFARPYVARYGGLWLTANQMLIGSAMMVPVAFALGAPLDGSLDFDTEGWAILITLAIPGAALMVLIYILAINMTTPTGVTMTVGFNPLSAIVLGAIILGEPATARVLIGFFCIVCAVILANLERERPQPVPDEPGAASR